MGRHIEPISIQTPANRTVGQRVASIRKKGKAHTLLVLHIHNHGKAGQCDDCMKVEDGDVTRSRRNKAYMAMLADAKMMGW